MSWSTTFYYEQELRSSYMNNTIKGLIKPGIYNLNAALYTMPYEESAPGSVGVYLRIGKGSTFVFSNGYVVNNGKINRNLDLLGTYLVKCVAETDIDIHIATPNGDYSAILEETVPGSGISKAPVIFVYATFSYKEDAASSVIPNIRLAVPSSNPYLSTEASYMLPNEDQPEVNMAANESYLIIGVLLDNNKQPANYALGNNWRSSGEYNGRSAWLANHVFTGRGLPEYRGAISRNYGQQLPSVIFGSQYNKLYLTSGSFYYNSVIYQIDGQSWKTLYGQGTSPMTAAPDSTSGFLTDHVYSAPEVSTYTKSLPTLSGNASKVIVEFLFLAVKSEYARATSIDLSSLLSSSGAFSITRRFLPFRVICDDTPGNLDPQTALSTDFGLPSTNLIPLDISIKNLDRLKSFLNNKNILMPVVDKMRQNAESASPFLVPTNGESLVPVVISFRKINTSGTDIVEAGSSISYPAFTDASGTSGASAVNPANILSFFEIQASSFAIISNSLSVQEVYDVLPFLD